MKKEAGKIRPLRHAGSPLPAQGPVPLHGVRPIACGPEICGDLEAAEAREWVITNGVGGYASSTILGLNTRRYHGLLVAAAHPPLHRVVLLAKLEETVVTPSGRHELSVNRYGGMVHPEGHRYLEEFRLDPWPSFFYRIGEVLLEKSVFMLPGENATVIGYTLHAAPGPVELIVRPLSAMRGFQDLSEENDTLHPEIVEQSRDCLVVHPYENFPPLMIHHNAELVEPSACWYGNFEYLREQADGPAPGEKGAEEERIREDLWSPGYLRYLLRVGESCTMVASTGRKGTGDFFFHRRRIENTQAMVAGHIEPPGSGPLASRLAWTADTFFAHRSLHDPSEAFVMAGWPWMTAWGRDALVALPGLALCTRRYDLARSVLETLAARMKGGLIPVRFSEEDGAPEYDSADTSLWFIWAVWQYLRFSRDMRFVSRKMMDALQDILEGYLRGTQFGIGMDEDGLIRLREEETPLTWMDAREPGGPEAPGRAVTPRAGKPVEVNGLWYCALMIMGALAERLGMNRAKAYTRLARLVQQNFLRAFAAPRGALHDGVSSAAGPDLSVRPNMLIAASLPFSPLSKAQTGRVLAAVERHLLTPAGIRTLSAGHPLYQGRYGGDLYSKAHAYHQGTVWTWLIGPYVSAVCKARGLTRSTQASLAAQLKPYLVRLEEGSLGAVPELFEGDAPHEARGALSSAWGTGELLRAIKEAKLAGL